MRLLISGYGGDSPATGAGHTAGIYDCEEKRFIWESGIPRISYMCTDETGQTLFGAGEHDRYGEIYMFKACGSGYRLADTRRVPGGSLCHVAYSPEGLLSGACYENGDLFAVAVKKDSFGETLYYARQGGAEKQGQESMLSRAHCAVFTADGRYMYSANIALDRIYCYEIANGVPKEQGFTSLDKGVGPRHILVLSDTLYVITEYSNEIIRLQLEAPDRPVYADRAGMLPSHYKGPSFGSTLCYYPQSSVDFAGYVYAANRGANTIAVFKRRHDGTLHKVHDNACVGDWPRHIALVGGLSAKTGLAGTYPSPMLAVANERTGRVSLCPIHPADGSIGGEACGIPFAGASFVYEL